jgi:signal transduction histidine kinase
MAISNALRHAAATVLSVNLRFDPPDLVLEVKDNGCGVARTRRARQEGFGLANMRDRAAKLGAEFDIRTEAGRGTRIVVRLPLPDTSHGD